MNKCLYILLLILVWESHALAQYPIGNTTITFNDAGRNGRAIETHIYYPATTAGANTMSANGQFPIIVVGHGFLMSYTTYQYLWEHLVPLGYIVALPATETGGSPSHADFGADLSYVVQAIRQENTRFASPLYLHVDSKAAIMGHSMGGGASFLATAADTTITTMITFAAAETTPSAISAASNISIPTLTLAGDEDCVTPPATNQRSMYDSLSDCKAYALLHGGSHCQFANSGSVCEFGEFSCNRANFMTRTAQQSAIKTIITPWLAAWLYQDYTSWLSFSSLTNSTDPDYTVSLVCSSNAPTAIQSANNSASASTIKLYPNPTTQYLTVEVEEQESRIDYSIINTLGQAIKQGEIKDKVIDVLALPKGTYQLILRKKTGIVVSSFVKL